MKAQSPEFPLKEIARSCGQSWKSLLPNEKAFYIEMAKNDKDRYEKEYAMETVENGGTPLPFKIKHKNKQQPKPVPHDFSRPTNPDMDDA